MQTWHRDTRRMRSPEMLNKLIFRRIMPLLIAAYVMAFIDRTNIGMAKDRLEIDLGLSATAYGGWCRAVLLDPTRFRRFPQT